MVIHHTTHVVIRIKFFKVLRSLVISERLENTFPVKYILAEKVPLDRRIFASRIKANFKDIIFTN